MLMMQPGDLLNVAIARDRAEYLRVHQLIRRAKRLAPGEWMSRKSKEGMVTITKLAPNNQEQKPQTSQHNV